ncbi:MAG TPA: hypothetical protein VN026_14870 [Bacteroidia bacterium]|jgi:hypothetical protein|nr:hypothetical protein [Bacteroidia bacterium]
MSKDENDALRFLCYSCRKENFIKRSDYIGKNEDYFLEVAGTVPSKDVIIPCRHCNDKNKVNIPYY